MDTVWHAFWTYLIFRRKKYLPLTLLGAVIPDIANLFMMGLNFLLYGFTMETYGAPKIPAITLYANYAMHSILLIALLGIFCYYLARPLLPLTFGLGFHAIIDYATHNADAYPPFFPLSLIKFPSPVSYWDPAHYGYALMLVNLVLVSIAFWYLFKTLKKPSYAEIGLFVFGVIYLLLLSWFYLANQRIYELIVNGVLPLLLFVVILSRGIVSYLGSQRMS